MESISEPVWWRRLKFLLPPLLCAFQYLLAGTVLFIIVLCELPMVMTVLYIVLFVASLALSPIWARTFFDLSYVGCDSPDLVEWSDSMIRFRGSYFDIEVPVQNLVSFKVGTVINIWQVNVKVAKFDGGYEQMRLSRTMDDADSLLDFLEEIVPEEGSLASATAA